MTSELAAAPVALVAGNVDLADHALADERAGIGLGYFRNELVAWRARETVVAALQLEIGIADARAEKAEEREALGARGQRHIDSGDGSVLQVDSQHGDEFTTSWGEYTMSLCVFLRLDCLRVWL